VLVCSVSMRARQASIVAGLVEVAAALDSPGTGNVVFATLVDDPAAVVDLVDAYLGEIMLEAASAGDTCDASVPAVLAADVVESTAADSTQDATLAAAFATFNGTPSSAFITLSNGNLTVTKNTSTNSGMVGSTNFLGSGKYYFEYTNTQKSAGTGHYFGMLLSTGVVGDMTSGLKSTTAAPAGTTIIYSNDVNTGKTIGTAASGNVYAYAIDLTGRLAWIRRAGGNWNGDAAANPATGVGGVTIGAGSFAPAVYFSTSGLNDSLTANFGASAFVGTVPSGFTAGWPG
jgi:hypothetical protein